MTEQTSLFIVPGHTANHRRYSLAVVIGALLCSALPTQAADMMLAPTAMPEQPALSQPLGGPTLKSMPAKPAAANPAPTISNPLVSLPAAAPALQPLAPAQPQIKPQAMPAAKKPRGLSPNPKPGLSLPQLPQPQLVAPQPTAIQAAPKLSAPKAPAVKRGLSLPAAQPLHPKVPTAGNPPLSMPAVAPAQPQIKPQVMPAAKKARGLSPNPKPGLSLPQLPQPQLVAPQPTAIPAAPKLTVPTAPALAAPTAKPQNTPSIGKTLGVLPQQPAPKTSASAGLNTPKPLQGPALNPALQAKQPTLRQPSPTAPRTGVPLLGMPAAPTTKFNDGKAPAISAAPKIIAFNLYDAARRPGDAQDANIKMARIVVENTRKVLLVDEATQTALFTWVNDGNTHQRRLVKTPGIDMGKKEKKLLLIARNDNVQTGRNYEAKQRLVWRPTLSGLAGGLPAAPKVGDIGVAGNPKPQKVLPAASSKPSVYKFWIDRGQTRGNNEFLVSSTDSINLGFEIGQADEVEITRNGVVVHHERNLRPTKKHRGFVHLKPMQARGDKKREDYLLKVRRHQGFKITESKQTLTLWYAGSSHDPRIESAEIVADPKRPAGILNVTYSNADKIELAHSQANGRWRPFRVTATPQKKDGRVQLKQPVNLRYVNNRFRITLTNQQTGKTVQRYVDAISPYEQPSVTLRKTATPSNKLGYSGPFNVDMLMHRVSDYKVTLIARAPNGRQFTTVLDQGHFNKPYSGTVTKAYAMDTSKDRLAYEQFVASIVRDKLSLSVTLRVDVSRRDNKTQPATQGNHETISFNVRPDRKGGIRYAVLADNSTKGKLFYGQPYEIDLKVSGIDSYQLTCRSTEDRPKVNNLYGKTVHIKETLYSNGCDKADLKLELSDGSTKTLAYEPKWRFVYNLVVPVAVANPDKAKSWLDGDHTQIADAKLRCYSEGVYENDFFSMPVDVKLFTKKRFTLRATWKSEFTQVKVLNDRTSDKVYCNIYFQRIKSQTGDGLSLRIAGSISKTQMKSTQTSLEDTKRRLAKWIEVRKGPANIVFDPVKMTIK